MTVLGGGAGGSVGTLTGPATVNVSGLTAWSGGAMTGAGVTNANGGMTISDNVSGPTLSGRTINNAGTAIVTSTFGLWSNGGIFNNLATGTFDIRANTTFSNFGGATPTFNNSGTLIRSAGTGTTIFDFIAFNNTGIVIQL